MFRDFFRWGTKKNTVLRTAIKVLLICYFLALLLVIFETVFQAYIDFPCFVEISSDGCLIANRYSNDTVTGNDIEVYLSDCPAGFHGGGCWHRESNASEVSAGGHVFKRDGEKLVIDSKVILAENETWENNRTVFTWDPWRVTKEQISVKNRGIVSCTEDREGGNVSPYGPTLVVTGYKRGQYEANYIGIVIFLILIGLLIYFYHKRDVEAPTQGHEEGG